MNSALTILAVLSILAFICGCELSYEKNGKKTYLINIKPLSERLK